MVIILTGPDTFRSQQRLQQLRAAFESKHDPSGLNIVRLDSETAKIEDLRDALATAGLFASRRMVILDRYDRRRAVIKPAELEQVLQAVPKDDALIVVLREIMPDTVRGKQRASPLEVSKAKREEFGRMAAAGMLRWAGEETRRRGYQFSQAALERLVSLVDGDTWRMHGEIEKLATFASGRPVSVNDVDSLTIDEAESNIFELVDAVGLRQFGRALQLLSHEIELGTNPVSVVAMLQRHIERLVAAKDSGIRTPAEFARVTGIHPFVASKVLTQARGQERSELVRWHNELFQIDRDIKSTPLDAETLLSILFGRIA